MLKTWGNSFIKSSRNHDRKGVMRNRRRIDNTTVKKEKKKKKDEWHSIGSMTLHHTRAGHKTIAPKWASLWSYLLSAVQVNTTHCRFYREQLCPHLLRPALHKTTDWAADWLIRSNDNANLIKITFLTCLPLIDMSLRGRSEETPLQVTYEWP